MHRFVGQIWTAANGGVDFVSAVRVSPWLRFGLVGKDQRVPAGPLDYWMFTVRSTARRNVSVPWQLAVRWSGPTRDGGTVVPARMRVTGGTPRYCHWFRHSRPQRPVEMDQVRAAPADEVRDRLQPCRSACCLNRRPRRAVPECPASPPNRYPPGWGPMEHPAAVQRHGELGIGELHEDRPPSRRSRRQAPRDGDAAARRASSMVVEGSQAAVGSTGSAAVHQAGGLAVQVARYSS